MISQQIQECSQTAEAVSYAEIGVVKSLEAKTMAATMGGYRQTDGDTWNASAPTLAVRTAAHRLYALLTRIF